MAGDAILRVIACGSVDDGKSTLIGRLLAETASVPDDLLDHARKTRRGGSTVPAGHIDFSLLTDGLEAERTQGITIDVAYRHLYLPSGQRAIIADAPGHEQYTRNMAVAASTADLAILLVDPTKGIRPQTHRHLTVCALMGVQTVIVAVNKMDAVGYRQDRFEMLGDGVRRAAARLGIDDPTVIPVSALAGDNVVTASEATSWYGGPTLLDALSQAQPAPSVGARVGVRLPVQYVFRANASRVYTGTLVAGTLRVGDAVVVARSGIVVRVSRLLAAGRDAAEALPGSAVAVELDRDVDIARGDLLIDPSPSGELLATTAFSADLVWTGDQALVCGHSYLLVAGAATVPAVVTTVCGRLELTTGQQLPARSLEINDIGVVEVVTDTAVPLEEYRRCREGGGFILVDRPTRDTVAAGMIRQILRRDHNVVGDHTYPIDRAARARLKGQRPRVVWLTGLPGSGTSTIADALERRLHAMGLHTYVLDGDNIRTRLNIAETAKLMLDAGLIVIVTVASSLRSDRQAARDLFDDGDLIEVFVDTPTARNPNDRYEPPEPPELVLDATADLEASTTRLIEVMMRSAQEIYWPCLF